MKPTVGNLLRILPYRQREILKLRYGLGDGYRYTPQEIARIFRCDVDAVRRTLLLAEMKLANRWGPAWVLLAGVRIVDPRRGRVRRWLGRLRRALTAAIVSMIA